MDSSTTVKQLENKVKKLQAQLKEKDAVIKRLAREVPATSLKMQRLNINASELLTPDEPADSIFGSGPGEQWTAAKVRQTFMEFFLKKKNHEFVPSSPVVPYNDETLLFANAGMNQFKPIFLGQIDPSDPRAKLKRAVNTQKCLRAGGKHNDLEDVGKDLYHHTFFEMLGNWSFGDFGKKEIIDWSWELLTEVYGLDPERLYVSYYEGDENGNGRDEEAREIWLNHLPDSHIIPFDAKENFWEMGDVGPCGPCSEITYDRIGGRNAAHLVNADDPDVLEIWNLVFMTKNRLPDGSLEDLPFANVDTGMGFERLTSVLQDKRSNYDTDVFTPLFDAIQELSKGAAPAYGGKIGEEDVGNIDMAYRVIADHIRTLTFAITDGSEPGNSSRGYVLRRVLRRAARYGQEVLKLEPLFLTKLVSVVVREMKGAFPELEAKEHFVAETILSEEQAFQRTLKKGLEYFKKEVVQMKARGETVVPGKMSFFLYGSMGFPVDLTELMAEEHGMTLDRTDFERLYREDQEMSRLAGKNRAGEGRSLKQLEAKETSYLESQDVKPTVAESKYEWYMDVTAKVAAIFDGEEFVQETIANGGKDKVYGVILDRSNFYYESGGQLGDWGTLGADGKLFNVENCLSSKGYVVHVGTVNETSAAIKVGDELTATVDYERRQLLANNHTATHVLNLGLRKVLGNEVDQKGSLVAADKLRFDFNSKKGMTREQLHAVESIVTEQIHTALPVYSKVVPLADAQKVTALRAVFGETYPDPVRVVIVGKSVDEVIADPENKEWENYSVELCGGTHIRNSADIKSFALIEESGISKGTRRIVALTGEDAVAAAERAQTLRARFEAAFFLQGDALIEEEKQLGITLDASVISASVKDELREMLKKLTKRVIAHKKEKAEQVMQLAKKEVQGAVEKIKAAGGKHCVLLLEQEGDSAAKLVLTAAKASPELSFVILMKDSAKNKLMVAIVAAKVHQTELSVSAKDWLAAINAKTGGKGGGKPDKANGQADLAAADVAKEAALAYAAEKFA